MEQSTVEKDFDRYIARRLLLEAARRTGGPTRTDNFPGTGPQQTHQISTERLLALLRQQQARRLLGGQADQLAPRAEPEADADGEAETEEKKNRCGCLRGLKRGARKIYSLVKSEIGMVSILVGYAALGAWVFSSIEGPHEKKMMTNLDGAQRSYLKDILNATGRAGELNAFIECERFISNESSTDSWNDTMFVEPVWQGDLDGNLTNIDAGGSFPNWRKCSEMVERLGLVIDKYFDEMLNTKLYGQLNKGAMTWNYWGAMFYCATIFTTVGYGNIVAQTRWGRIATMIYALIGIPLCLVVLGKLGSSLTRLIKFFWAFGRRFYYTGSCLRVRRFLPQSRIKLSFVQRIRRRLSKKSRRSASERGANGGEDMIIVAAEVEDMYVPTEIDENFNLPPIVAILIAFGYILLGAFIYKRWETSWDWLVAFYFTFISLSTVGLGDVIPEHPKFFMATSFYLLIGFALIAMVINVVMESVRSTIDLAKEQLITLGHNIIPLDSGPCTPIIITSAEHLAECKKAAHLRRGSV